MNKQQLKDLVCQAIDEHAQQIVQVAQEIGKTPELGFKETKTAAAVSKFLGDLNYSCQQGLALTGVKAQLKPGAAGPNIAVIG